MDTGIAQPKKKVIISEIKPMMDSTAPVRVAFYVRVSTDSEEQMNSFENQKAAVQIVLKQHPEFTLVKIYADAGITGTLAEKRPGFMEMIADCESGKIDLIYTKSLSRWSRNTLECLQYYRALKDIGVNLIFEKESIDTRNVFTEMALSIYASFSQEESRSISENTKMGIRMRYQMGQDHWAPIFGYRKDYVIEESEAEIVRKIFDMYEHGYSVREIMAYLDKNNIPSPRNSKWSTTSLFNILKNEKYTGDVVMQKSYTTDHLTHKVVRNDGTVLPTYTVIDHHAAIIPHEQFDIVQRMFTMHRFGSETVQLPFGDRLFCPYCGKKLKQRYYHGGAWAQGRGWECACGEFQLKAKSIEDAVMDGYVNINMDSVRERLDKMRPEKRKAAEQLIAYKESGEVTEPQYYWIDRLIDRIEFGRFESKTDNVLIIRWKFGLTSTRPVKTRKTPRKYAELQHKSKNKKGRGSRKNKG